MHKQQRQQRSAAAAAAAAHQRVQHREAGAVLCPDLDRLVARARDHAQVADADAAHLEGVRYGRGEATKARMQRPRGAGGAAQRAARPLRAPAPRCPGPRARRRPRSRPPGDPAARSGGCTPAGTPCRAIYGFRRACFTRGQPAARKYNGVKVGEPHCGLEQRGGKTGRGGPPLKSKTPGALAAGDSPPSCGALLPWPPPPPDPPSLAATRWVPAASHTTRGALPGWPDHKFAAT